MVWPGLPLAQDTPNPLYFSFNHSVMSISLDNKGTIPVSCAAHDVAPHWSLKLLLQRIKVPSRYYPWISSTWLTKHTCKTKEDWELSPVPTLSYVPVDTSSQCKASFDYCIFNKSFLIYYATLLTVYLFVTDGFIYSALKDSETAGHIDQSTPL